MAQADLSLRCEALVQRLDHDILCIDRAIYNQRDVDTVVATDDHAIQLRAIVCLRREVAGFSPAR